MSVGPGGCDPAASKFFILVHRTRREHFNLITLQSRAVFSLEDLPSTVTCAWNLLGASHAAGESTVGGMRSRGGGGEGRGPGKVLSPGDMPAPGQALRARQYIDLTAVDSRAAGSAPETPSSENDRRSRDVSRPSKLKRPVVEGAENEGESVKKQACAKCKRGN